MTRDRDPRDPRQPDEPRDERDVRESDDPRDPRDPRLEGDPRLGDEIEDGIPRFVKTLVVGIIVGLIAVILGAWQLAEIRSREDQRGCERVVAGRVDNRAMWIWLAEQFPDETIEIGLLEELDEQLPLLTCSHGNPTVADSVP